MGSTMTLSKKLKYFLMLFLYSKKNKMTSNRFYNLPKDLQIIVYEYDADHREKMYPVLQQISEANFCGHCARVLLRYVYTSRQWNDHYCSVKCYCESQEEYIEQMYNGVDDMYDSDSDFE